MNSRYKLLPVALLLILGQALAYPLDGDDSGIRRLEGYRMAQQSPRRSKLPVGALLPTAEIRLHLTERPAWDLDESDRDPQLQQALQAVFASRDPSYGIVVIDYTDPNHIRWAGLREDRAQAPGSVGKVLCMLALFDGLQRAFPDPLQRARVLRDTWVDAGDWVIKDSHKVPRLNPDGATLNFAVILPEDRFKLAEWVDHMISPSANAAGSVVWREAILLRAFGADYPPSAEQAAAFFRTTPRNELRDLAQTIINQALIAADLAPEQLRVGNLWTRNGQRLVPGVGGSTATPGALARFLLRLEQGRLVDTWSSLEMKRYLYMTKRRYRYVYAPELAKAAVYFKSGSLFRCMPEPDYLCEKYKGNRQNAMNSIVIVESPAALVPTQRRYLVALTSDVRKVNSAWDHSRLGAAIEEIVRSRSAVKVQEQGSADMIKDSGKSD